MVSVANLAFVPQLESILTNLPQSIIEFNEVTSGIISASSTTRKSNRMSSTSTPPHSQPDEIQSPRVVVAAAASSRLTDFSIAAILGNTTGAPGSTFCNQTFTAIQNSPLVSNTYCDTNLHIVATNNLNDNNQLINKDNNGQSKQAACKRIRPKKYQCPYCWVALSNTGQFKGHIRIHTGERPFICECGKSFTRNEELTRHRRIHTGLRPYSCHICNKCFGRKDHLKKHTRTHEKGAGGGGGGGEDDNDNDKLDESSANAGEDLSTTNRTGEGTDNCDIGTKGGGGGGGGGSSSGSSSSSSSRSTSGSSCNGSSSNYSDHSALSSPHQQMAPTNFDISGYLSAMNLFSNMMANTPRYSY